MTFIVAQDHGTIFDGEVTVLLTAIRNSLRNKLLVYKRETQADDRY